MGSERALTTQLFAARKCGFAVFSRGVTRDAGISTIANSSKVVYRSAALRSTQLSRQHHGASHGEPLARALCRRLDVHRDGHARCEKLLKRRRARCRHGRCRGALVEC